MSTEHELRDKEGTQVPDPNMVTSKGVSLLFDISCLQVFALKDNQRVTNNKVLPLLFQQYFYFDSAEQLV